MKTAIVIGNSSGIGAALTRRLLGQNFEVVGISKSPSPIAHPQYVHTIQDVTEDTYRSVLSEVLSSLGTVNLCVYCAGVGETLDPDKLSSQTKVFQVNTMAAVVTTELVVTQMLKQGHGHFIGLSSMADSLILPEAPSYCATKAGISRFWESLALGLSKKSVKITNVRFGFVDTKMAKAPIRPFMLSVEKAVDFIISVIKRPRVRATKPKIVIPLVWLINVPNRFRLAVFHA